jgi:nitroreductase
MKRVPGSRHALMPRAALAVWEMITAMHDHAASRDQGHVGPPESATTSDGQDLSEFTQLLIASRQNVSPKRLVAPGPDDSQLASIFAAAAAAPDHGEITPWRFVIVPPARRALLAEVFALALIDRDPSATPVQVDTAREKARRAPLLMLAVARLGVVEPDIPATERLLSIGCAIQNMLLAAHAMGFGCGLTSGQALGSPRLRDLFTLADGETAACFVNIGTAVNGKPGRVRPDASAFVSLL